ncbi:MAG: dihydropteroate synthase [Firmicutes bacterium]|nr:dihydropteroate synthase [Bacillota bacterium]
MKIGNRDFSKHTGIMGILNVTPDSFSDGGCYNSVDKALFRTEQMLKEGADIIDVGGESTRPGYVMISEKEEIYRVSPVIEAIKREFDCLVSIDTYKSNVAKAAIDSGADIINDIWGFKYDNTMARVAATMHVHCCIMHNRKNKEYNNFCEDMLADLRESVAIAEEAGIDKNMLVLDPGVGFAKSYEQNLMAMNNLERLGEITPNFMLAASRKSVIGLALDLDTDERLEGTLATTVIAVMKGAQIVRVHDVEQNRRAILMAEKIMGKAI